jgi:catechol 2,3-dioxygenase-like lactoylglutathione lyase family enzyme
MRLHHVTIPRPPGSATTARRFYGDLLGLSEIALGDEEENEQAIWFGAGDTEIHLIVEELGGQDRSGRHFCLAVDDVEALRLRLQAAGVAVVGEGPRRHYPRYFIRDPFGNLLEIATYAQDSTI